MSSPPKPVSLGRASLDGDLAKRAAAAVREWNYVASGDTTAPDHPLKGAEVLHAKGWPEEIVRAILGHAHWGGVERDTPLAKTLFAVDELVGFAFACAYVQPSKCVADVNPSSVKKWLKDKGFARTVSLEDIALGISEIGISAEEHIANVIAALTEAAPSLGLAGA